MIIENEGRKLEFSLTLNNNGPGNGRNIVDKLIDQLADIVDKDLFHKSEDEIYVLDIKLSLKKLDAKDN